MKLLLIFVAGELFTFFVGTFIVVVFQPLYVCLYVNIAVILSNVECVIWFYVKNHFQNVKLLPTLKSYRQNLLCSMVRSLGRCHGRTASSSLVSML